MNEIDKTNFTDQAKYRLNEITKIENYFIEEMNQRKSCIKKLSKYVTTFDYIDEILVVLTATGGWWGLHYLFVLFLVLLEHQLE